MRVLMLSDVFFPRVNGVSTSIQTFRHDLAARGCETWLIAPEYPKRWQDDERVLRQPSRYLAFDPEDRMMKSGATLDACMTLAGKVDVLHVQTPFVAHHIGIKAARALQVPVVETYHTFFEEYLHHYLPLLPAGIARAIARTFSRRQCNGVDAVIAPSQQLADVLRRYGVTRPIETIPTGLNLDEFAGGDGDAFRARYGIALGRPVMLLVGRVAHEKNIGFLLEVLAEVARSVPKVLFVIAGEGPALPALKRAAAEARLDRHVYSWATSIGAVRCSTAIAPRTCSCSRRAPKRRDSCCSKVSRSECPSCRRPCSARRRCSRMRRAHSSCART